MKLYHCPKTRSFRPLWLLEELQIDYEIETVDIFSGQGQSEHYLQLNPLGKVPTLDDDGLILYEAGAICMYLADKYAKDLAPPLDSKQRALYYQWMFFVPATLEPPLVNIFLHSRLLPETQRLPALVEQSKKQFHPLAQHLDRVLQDKSFLLGDTFSTADIMMASTLQWMPERIEAFSGLQAYLDRATQRPAYLRARQKE